MSEMQHILDRRALCGHLTTKILDPEQVPSGASACPVCLERYEAIITGTEPEFEYALKHNDTLQHYLGDVSWGSEESIRRILSDRTYPNYWTIVRRRKASEWEDVQ